MKLKSCYEKHNSSKSPKAVNSEQRCLTNAKLLSHVLVTEKPSKPTGPFTVDNVTENSADLQWNPPESDGGTPLTSYIIEVRPDSRSTWTKAGSVSGTTNTFTVPDLKVDTEYHFRVIAVNAEGQSAPLEAKDTAKPVKKIGRHSFFLAAASIFSVVIPGIRNASQFSVVVLPSYS